MQTDLQNSFDDTDQNNRSIMIHIHHELKTRQLATVPSIWKLHDKGMERICKHITVSIFGDQCCIWNGYVTNAEKPGKGPYINFYHRKKKTALHRLLYSNYVAPLSPREYLKFSCQNKGICCNVNHLERYCYTNQNSEKSNPKIDTKKRSAQITIRKDVVLDFN